MNLIVFRADAGEKLLDLADLAASTPDAVHQHERECEQTLTGALRVLGMPVGGLVVAFDAATSTVTLAGPVADQPSREKIILCVGNVQGVRQVLDLLDLPPSMQSAPAQLYAVQAGETLSSIAAKVYGDPGQYRRIFDANQPMLSDPGKIYPGLMLRLPT
jgi:hypothetical protein